MRPLVIIASTNPVKAERVKQLYFKNRPDMEHDMVLIYNGDIPYSRADIYTVNDRIARDIGMYHEVVSKTGRPFYFFMNEDIVHIEGDEWLGHALEKGSELVGVQPNLASFIPLEMIEAVDGKNYPYVRWGNHTVHVRTSAFACTRDYFFRVWKICKGVAGVFEKNTIAYARDYSFFDDPFYICDSDSWPYHKYTR